MSRLAKKDIFIRRVELFKALRQGWQDSGMQHEVHWQGRKILISETDYLWLEARGYLRKRIDEVHIMDDGYLKLRRPSCSSH